MPSSDLPGEVAAIHDWAARPRLPRAADLGYPDASAPVVQRADGRVGIGVGARCVEADPRDLVDLQEVR